MILPKYYYKDYLDRYKSFFDYKKKPENDPKKPENFEISRKGLLLIKRFEGFSSTPYRDAKGVPTIGYGFTYYPNGESVKMTDRPISRKQALEIMDKLLDKYEHAVNEAVTSDINQNKYDALVSFTYNCGIGALNTSTLLKMVNQNPDDTEIRDEFPKWKYSGGQVIDGLLRRRKQEARLYFS